VRILVIHQNYLFPGQPGGSRFNEMARLWVEAGHQVTVIAGNLNYATGDVPPPFRRRWVARQTHTNPGVAVWRCYVPRTYNRSYLGRMWAFFGFTLSATTAALMTRRPDVVIVTSPPLITVIPGWIAARWRERSVPWIFEVRDLWPESAVTTGVLAPDAWITRLLYAIERWACRHCDLVNVLTPAFRDDIVGRGLASPEKITLVPNGVDVNRFVPRTDGAETRRALGWGDRCVALYAGAHGRANALGQLVAVAERLRHRPDILIATVGDGPERVRWQAEARRQRLDNIVFQGSVPSEEIPDVVAACDIGVAVLQSNPTFRTVYPNKVFDYMACAKPVVLAIDGAARRLVCDEAQAGRYAPAEDPDALAAAIVALTEDRPERDRLGRNGRAWVVANASREMLATRYLDILHRLALAGPGASADAVGHGAA
jgi:glycosyltransferase involved in cell wall biosynthesis